MLIIPLLLLTVVLFMCGGEIEPAGEKISKELKDIKKILKDSI